MRRVFLFFALLLAPLSAFAQKPPINGVAGPSSSAAFQSITTDARGTGGLTFGGATVTGTLTPGNVPTLTSQGIQDSGSQLITTMCPGCVPHNPTSNASGAVVLSPVLNLPPGTNSAPSYSSYQDATTGLYFRLSGRMSVTTGGNALIEFATATGVNTWLMNSNATPTLTAVGTVPAQISGGTNNGVDLMVGGATSYATRTSRNGSAANYNYLRILANDSGSAVQLQTVAAGASPDASPTLNVVPGGTGTFQYKGTEVATRGANTFAGTQTFATSSTGAGTQTFTNSPCSGLTSEQWIPVGITGQTGTWFIPACQ